MQRLNPCESVLNTRTARNLSLKWSHSTGAAYPVYSSPTAANGVVYVGSDDGNVYAFGLK